MRLCDGGGGVLYGCPARDDHDEADDTQDAGNGGHYDAHERNPAQNSHKPHCDDVQQHGDEELVEAATRLFRHRRRLFEGIEAHEHDDECGEVDDACDPARQAEKPQDGRHDGEDGCRAYLADGRAFFLLYHGAQVAQPEYVEYVAGYHADFDDPYEYPHEGEAPQEGENAGGDGAYREDKYRNENVVGRSRPVLYILFHTKTVIDECVNCRFSFAAFAPFAALPVVAGCCPIHIQTKVAIISIGGPAGIEFVACQSVFQKRSAGIGSWVSARAMPEGA